MALTFHAFLTQEKTAHPVTCLTSPTYPLLFIAQVRMVVAHDVSTPVETVNVKEVGLQTVKRLLQTSFLGMRKIYFLHEVDEVAESEKKELLAYLAHYTGPNSVYITMQAVDGAYTRTWQVVELPDKVERATWDALSVWYGVTSTERTKKFAAQVFKKNSSVSLEAACLLMRYMQLIGSSSQEFFGTWLDLVVPPEQSLFELSQHFFKKNAHDFFVQWHAVKDLYPAQFWVSFWSEQLWRASMFVMLSKKQQRAQARAIAFRLPFSFINHDWKNYSAATLAKAHDKVYMIDYDLKNGGSEYAFDILFSQFFSGSLA